MQVEAILRTKGDRVMTIGTGATIADAVRELAAHDIGALVVSDDGETIAGIISERDIVRALADGGEALMRRQVRELMSSEVRVCSPEDSVNDLMADMTRWRMRHLPVLRDGRLRGIISIGDVVKSRIEEVEFEADSLRSYVAG